MKQQGYCYIYRRATLYREDQPPQIIAYADGVDPEMCTVDMSGPFPTYHWTVAGETHPIPMNVPRTQTESILNAGEIPVEEGIVKYEFIFGKFRSRTQHYTAKFIAALPLLLLIAILLMRR